MPEPAISTVVRTLEEQPNAASGTGERGNGSNGGNEVSWAPHSVESRTIQAAGKERHFLLSLPAGARQRDKLPVVFAFHGYRENPEKMRRVSQLDRADAIVAYMAGIDDAWAPAPYAATSGEEDLAFVDAVLAQLEGEFSIDPARVFATGMSNGGGFAAYVGCQRPQEFTGIGTVSAAFYERVSEGCSYIPMKHIDIHGTGDTIIAYDGGQRHETVYDSEPEMFTEAAARNHCAARAEETEISPTVTEFTWAGCDALLVHYRVSGGPHTWQGGADDHSKTTSPGFATRAQLEFFGIGYTE